MPIQKQNLNISFQQGLDTKTDPWQVETGKFLSLQNQVFTKGGRLTKRNGYQQLTALPNTSSVYLTTLNDNLTAIGTSIYAYNDRSGSWVSKGTIQPLTVDTLPLIKNNINQTQCDAAVAANGLVCTVYSEINNGVTDYRYAIADSVTGQNIVAPSAIPVGSGTVTGSPRVFILANYFVIVFTNVVSATSHLQYISISTATPTNVTANQDIAAAYVSSTTLSWDGYVVGQNLYIAYNTTSGTQSVKVAYLTASQASVGAGPSAAKTYSGKTATLMSVTADVSVPSQPIIWVNFYDSGSSTGFALAVDQNLNAILAPTATIASGTVVNIATAVQNGVCSLLAEVSNFYGYDSSTPSNYINAYSITTAGVVSGPAVVIRSVGLASKAFVVNGTVYCLVEYLSQYQPTYFLINAASGTQAIHPIVGKLAYGNGNAVAISSSTLGYLPLGLPAVTVQNGNVCYVPYLFKDLIAAVNKGTALASGTQTAGIYSQTGINLGTFTIGTKNLDTAEIGNDLLISGGYLGMYDGYLPVEQNFFVWPDNIKATITADIAVTGTTHTGTNSITSITTTGIVVGMTISGTDIPGGTTVIAVGASTVTMSANAVTGHSETITFGGKLDSAGVYYYQVTYEWTDNQGNAYRSAPSIPTTSITETSGHTFSVVNIPTLRLTKKVANPVKIVIYRYSVAQQIYYQVTSLTAPLLNDTTIDSVTFTDIYGDASILGNNIIYTNGGVVENINAPASNIFTLFDTRFWMVDAEDQNLLWFSKQVIEATPVEMSDLFTFYVAPTQAAQGSTGPITALAPMDDKLIIFKQNAIYYINGTGPDNTGSNNQYSQPIFITSTVGCANQQSIVFMPQGLMFQSDKGIWLLGRDLSTSYVGSAVEAFNGSLVESAINVPETNQVRFTLNTGETLMYDYFYSQWGTFVGAPGISSCIFQGLHTFLNSFGEVYQENTGSYLDGANPVLLGLTTSWLNLAGLQGYQRAFFFYLLGQYLTPHKLQLSIAYDYNPSPTQSSLISPTNYSQPYGGANPNPGDGTDSQDPYGQGTPYGGESAVENWRVFLTKQRCQSFQITLQEIYDPSFGVSAGAGLTLSGINLVWGYKKGFRPIGSAHSIGGGNR